MIVLWSPAAHGDLQELYDYVAEDDPAAAQRMALRIVQSVESLLPEQANIGRPGRVPGTRELVVAKTPYVIPYRIRRNRVEVLRVYHSARRWPERF